MGSGIPENLYKRYLKITETHSYNLNPFEFNNSFFCTSEFSSWWEKHYRNWSVGDATQVLSRLRSGFVIPQLLNKPVPHGRGNFYLISSLLIFA
jgi:hypothetical protein